MITNPAKAEPAPVPIDVATAYQLWWGVVGFGFVNLLGSLALMFGERSSLAEQLLKDVTARDPNLKLTQDSVELMVFAGMALVAVIGLVVGAVALVIGYQMRRGRQWARTLLTMIGVLLVILAVPNLLGLAAPDSAAMLVIGGASIVQAVLAAGAIYLIHRKESNAYFLQRFTRT